MRCRGQPCWRVEGALPSRREPTTAEPRNDAVDPPTHAGDPSVPPARATRNPQTIWCTSLMPTNGLRPPMFFGGMGAVAGVGVAPEETRDGVRRTRSFDCHW